MKKTLIGCAIAGAVFAGPALAADLPDMVVFITDDQSLHDSNHYGNKDLKTPNMNMLAEKGIKFNNAFVASPNSGPSRGAMLTGLMPSRNGAEANQTHPRDDIKKLPAYFQELGYEVAAFGKVAHSDAERYGFDISKSTEGFIWEGGIKDAVEYLNDRDKNANNKPLLMFVGTKDPHVPWPENNGFDPDALTVPEQFVDTKMTREYLARYYTAVEQADTQLGEVYKLVQDKLDNPLFIHTSDNGAQLPFSKWDLYDMGVRVPFVASWPSHIEEGIETDAMISWVDLLPTLLAVAGGEQPKGLDGKSFADVLYAPSTVHREKIYSTASGDSGINKFPIRSVQDAEFKYILNLYPEMKHDTHINISGASDGREYWDSWREKAKVDSKANSIVYRYYYRPSEELYDAKNDPNQLNNLADDPQYANRMKAMREDLERWMNEQGDKRILYKDPIGFKMKTLMGLSKALFFEEEEDFQR
ncbi:sulfatase [Photobacterium sagamiensis]|uniref:sulfatase family protein n=1 Tax=Photobacterium sagamiensis TaxID=2910241 RepID=UPI003D1389E2